MTDVIFLGGNDAGSRIYDWLCERDGTFVHAMITTKEQLRLVERVEPEYIVSCGYQHIIPNRILQIPTEGCLNVHPSYLPYNRGANPNVWSIVDGTPAGVTIHQIIAEVDAGDIIARQRVEKDFADTGKCLHERLEDAQVALFKDAWPKIVAGNATSRPQDLNEGTFHKTAEFDELCELDPNEHIKTEHFLNRLRALTFPPYDNARIKIDGEQYYVEVNIRGSTQ